MIYEPKPKPLSRSQATRMRGKLAQYWIIVKQFWQKGCAYAADRWPQLGIAFKRTTRQLRAFFQTSRFATIAVTVTAGVFLLMMAVGTIEPASANLVQKPITLPQPDANAKPTMAPELKWRVVEVQPGQSLAAIFSEQGLTPGQLYRVSTADDAAKQLARIFPGDELAFGYGAGKTLEKVRHTPKSGDSLSLIKTVDGWQSQTISRPITRQVQIAEGVIEDSLFVAGQQAGLTDAVIMQLATIFGWDIDFVRDIRAGDRFQLLYENHYRDGEFYKTGPILAARFINRGEVYEAVRYVKSNGDPDYFSPDGHPMRKAFLRSPLDVTRVTSRFTLKRYHPVLKINRPHRGVDYSARTGTPVRTTGDGRVDFAGKGTGYGNYVVVQHGSQYKTLYAHLSRFGSGIRKGARVRQGQVIGYSGATGLVTAPHLHYEFRVNDQHKDPLQMKFPKAEPLPEAEMQQFSAQTRTILAQLNLFDHSDAIAQE